MPMVQPKSSMKGPGSPSLIAPTDEGYLNKSRKKLLYTNNYLPTLIRDGNRIASVGMSPQARKGAEMPVHIDHRSSPGTSSALLMMSNYSPPRRGADALKNG